MNRTWHLLQSTVIVIVLFGVDKVVGLLRTRLVSITFGTSPAFDAFTAANQLPEVFVTLLAGGALAAAFIPVYSASLTSERMREAARLANSTLTLVLLVLGAVSALGALVAPWITRTLLVPDFSPEMQQLTSELMRIILVQTTIFGISGVLSSILNAHQHFALPALAPMALHLGYFAGIFLFVPTMGIHGLAWGTVVGGLLHILIQVPALLRYRFRYRPALGLNIAGMREIIRLMGPRIITLGVIQIADLFIIRLTSGMPPGSTSAYFYAYYLQQLPETLLGTAIGIVVFPTLAELYNAGQIEQLKRTAMNALKIVWTLTIPAGAALVLLGRPAITFFLEEGAFDERSTRLVYYVLIFFSVRVVSEATLEIVARLFYAQHNTRTPMAVALVWLFLTVPLSYAFTGQLEPSTLAGLALLAFAVQAVFIFWRRSEGRRRLLGLAFVAALAGVLLILLLDRLIPDLGIGGLALASTIAFTVQSSLLFFLNRRSLGSLYERELLVGLGRALVATAGMSVVIWLVSQVLASQILFLIAGVGVGGATYLILNLLLGGQEIPSLLRLIRPQTL